ncbi:ABC transporter permease [Ottowia sp.]|uniref:ABC transporter permease n=1 Tax=Ottowia sp. TaxID=1898956 RepID=UPI0025D0D8E7|nr:ABC transporter permease [Ottowia sp.]MBK6613741.1 ABC transporter permease [Ottowia sp.]MBK6616797.1 ABC transporter permease [Ottowia sp.]
MDKVTNLEIGAWERPIGPIRAQWEKQWVRKLMTILVLAFGWELYARALDSELLVPTFLSTIEVFFRDISNGRIISSTGETLKVLLLGYGAGALVALMLTVLAMVSRIGSDFLETLTSMFNPLPAIALLPLAMMWFGLGIGSMVFVLVHAVVWAIALNTQAGFSAVSNTLKMVGRNYGLTGIRFIALILIPAALPSILSGLRTAWAFAWRTLIAAELIFGVSSGSGGLGWYIFEQKNSLDISAVFAGLLAVILIGLIVEEGVFRVLEKVTIGKWGMYSV